MPTSEKGSLKERVLDAARHLLAKGGYGALSMRKLARAVERSTADLEEAAAQGIITLDTDPYSRVAAGAAMLHGIVALVLSQRLDKRLDRDVVVELVIQRALASPSFASPSFAAQAPA